MKIDKEVLSWNDGRACEVSDVRACEGRSWTWTTHSRRARKPAAVVEFIYLHSHMYIHMYVYNYMHRTVYNLSLIQHVYK